MDQTRSNSGERTKKDIAGDPRTRRRLMDAGQEVFGKKGYLDTTVDDIVRLAEVSRGTFYVYFRNKNDAFEQIIGETIDEMFVEAYGNREPGISDFEAIKRANLNYFKAVMKRRDLMRVLLQAETINPEVAGLHQRFRQKFLDRVRRNLERNLRPAPGTRLNHEVASIGLGLMVEWFGYFWLATSWLPHAADSSLEDVVETLSVLWYRAVYADNPTIPSAKATPTADGAHSSPAVSRAAKNAGRFGAS